MRFLALVLLLAAPAAAQPPAGELGSIVESIRQDFPLDHRAIATSLDGKTGAEARRVLYDGIDRFVRARRASILAAPGPSLVAIEARQGALLRTLGRQNVRLCASVGDRGFFSSEAAAGEPPAGIGPLGVALVEAAKAGAAPARPGPAATKEDFIAWLAAVEKIEPAVPVRAMLQDRALRLKSSPDQLCRGSAAMHEAVAALPRPVGERVARTLLGSAIGSPAP
ncbi:MAG: hypothetical protein QOJ91_1095 [Sphingomonadales bacterium]|jgi:hypothetical protein|nr:hypothetical protein [Sphingomonadales bacterium]